ncbi:MAG: glycosyltransferase family 2 protein, partial [Hyphomicrobiales bacterium]|nr:glycosyltransferase family 2 protein [Hyphomicrobiales bacterium]
MIVKNEADVIERCLDSIRPLVDFVLVEDTGSSDGTQEIIRKWLAKHGVKGVVIDEPWRSFEFNRSHSLAALRKIPDVDYAFIIDADDSIEIDPKLDLKAMKRSLDHDIYSVSIALGGVAYRRNQLCRNDIAFRYRGVLHEFLEPPSPEATSGHIDGIKMIARVEGARSKSPRKYLDDAKTLEEALEKETDVFMRSRYTYYLAQSYRDGGEQQLALKNFLARADLGFWNDEIFMSLFNAAGLMQELGRPVEEVVKVYLRASNVAPHRAEALHGAARLLREKERFEQAYDIAKRGVKIPKPDNGLFVQGWVYDYGLVDELSVSSYWTGRYEECLRHCTALLEGRAVPQDMLPRVRANAEFARQKLSAKGVMPEDDGAALRPLADVDLNASAASDGRAPIVAIFRKQTKIVRTIHVVWIGDETRRPDNCIDTWRDQNPDWRVVVWG